MDQHRVSVRQPDGTTQIFPMQTGVAVRMRRFVLDRSEDVTGCSGTGFVAEGVVFSDGTAALRWLTNLTSTAIYNNIVELIAIHGHDGATELVWIDDDDDT